MVTGGESTAIPVEAQDISTLYIKFELGRFEAEVCCFTSVEDGLKELVELLDRVCPKVDIVGQLDEVPRQYKITKQFVSELVLEHIHAQQTHGC